MGTGNSVAVAPRSWSSWLKDQITELAARLPKRKNVELAVEKSVSLGQKASATLVVVNGTRILLGVTAQSVCVLKEWTGELPVRGIVQ
jgi:flagellar biogenesis protein FliO